MSILRTKLICDITRRTLTSSVVPELNLKDFSIKNEPILSYLKGFNERKELEEALKEVKSKIQEIPIVIGGEEIRTNEERFQVIPHNHQHKIAKFYYADQRLIQKAIGISIEAQQKWDKTPIPDRLKIWEKAADLMAGKYRQKLNATTMLGQSKTAIQAEIDSACELVDFMRFNSFFLKENLKFQPISVDRNVTKNSVRFRGIDGFVAAISPFNFTAIGGNLAYTPALLGNSVLWKPSDTAILSNWTIFEIMREAGLPDGVVNFIPSHGPIFGDTITSSPYLSGINFTGSAPTFKKLWRQVGENIEIYRNFPRMIGECGGKNYHFVHPSADPLSVIPATIRSAFEYSGQKCSACSRAYIPESLWPQIKEGLLEERGKLKVGDATDFSTFMSAVIDETSFNRVKSYIDHANDTNSTEILGGGKYDKSVGYFVEPTIIQTTNPTDKLMTQEIFGPILTIFVYKDSELDKTMELVKNSTEFALTGAVFAQDEKFLRRALEDFKMSAGNFYINDKSTGSVVGQQPFGGGRMSGTNDKTGGPTYIMRWTTVQSIKETFVKIRDIDYPYMK